MVLWPTGPPTYKEQDMNLDTADAALDTAIANPTPETGAALVDALQSVLDHLIAMPVDPEVAERKAQALARRAAARGPRPSSRRF